MQNFSSPHNQSSYSFKTGFGTNAAYESLKNTISAWHGPTAEHSIRVRIQATYLGMALGLTGKELTLLSYGAELHDIGKIRIPLSVLNKTVSLTPSEVANIESHPTWGAEIASRAFVANSDIIACILQHHEREDGSGYPNGLLGLQINPLAKIIAVADTYAALREDRPYGERMTDAEALMVLLDDDRGRFDPSVVRMLAHVVMHSRVSGGD
jgi:putative nucleotidyltransferase with HDIG domain